MVKVLIGIQARSGSTRLPGKAFENIAGRTMIERVVQACKSTARHLTDSARAPTQVAVLVPEGDKLRGALRDVAIVEGPEQDVLERYRKAAEHFGAEFVVRITGDCPMIPSFVISRVTSLAVAHGYDYISNVDERYRTTLDGSDCEVISRKLLDDTAERALEAFDREHVTTLMRRDPPKWAKLGHVCNPFDLSAIKLSVDTLEDLQRVREAAEQAEEKKRKAILHFGRQAVHVI